MTKDEQHLYRLFREIGKELAPIDHFNSEQELATQQLWDEVKEQFVRIAEIKNSTYIPEGI